jgi:protein CpxP
MMAKRLSLTDDQKSKILPIIVERRQKIQELRTTSTLPRRQKMEQVRGIYEDSDKRINALLTAGQQKGYAAIEQEMRAHKRNRRSESATPTD